MSTKQPYPALTSRAELDSDIYKSNREQSLKELARLAQAQTEARAGGGEKYTTRHKERGKLLPRERVELLLDRDSHFLELCPLAGHGVSGINTGW